MQDNDDTADPDEDIDYLAPYQDGLVVVGPKGYQAREDGDTTRVIFLDSELQPLHEFSIRQEGPLRG